ncbi:MAG: DUF1801 domain-containing protein [Myxococcales bacterium]|nr:DUF1801 domain-containing protein [Myxococcales bacterium]
MTRAASRARAPRPSAAASKATAPKAAPKTAAPKAAAPKPAAKPAAAKPAAKAAPQKPPRARAAVARAVPPTEATSAGHRARPVTLLSGGNPQIAKADGDAPVQAYLAALPPWKQDIGRRLDALIVRTVPGVRKAVKWNSPFYGLDGQGWFLGLHTFTRYLKVAFFRGASLRPIPPGTSKGKDTRYLDIHEGDALDDALLASWVTQAAALPGWIP